MVGINRTNSSNKVTLGNNILAASGKRGILKPMDDLGFYMLRAGGFNIPNRGGITYALNDYVKECSNEDSEFGRRVSMGQMQCELGHPEQYYLEKINGQVVRSKITDVFEWIMRLKKIDQQNTCAFIRKVHFDFTGCDRDPVYNDIEICGYGVHKQIFIDGMENPDINLCVSIRTVTQPQRMGDAVRQVDYWSTYDIPVEQGMLVACKHLQAGLEDFLSSSTRDNLIVQTHDGIETDAGKLIEICESGLSDATNKSRYAGNESFEAVRGLLEVLKGNEFYRANKGRKIVLKGTSGLEAFL